VLVRVYLPVQYPGGQRKTVVIVTVPTAPIYRGVKKKEIEIEIIHNMCRQTGPTVVSRATLLRHSGLISKLGPGLFDKVHLSTHLASLCVDVPRELNNCK
jgi:hypothetical protein